jgi:hypothetical protein
MVYLGWPRAHEDDAVRAIRAGLEAVEAVSKLTSPTPLRARVGIHTGLVVVGETGQGDASIPKAAVGETPNIAETDLAASARPWRCKERVHQLQRLECRLRLLQPEVHVHLAEHRGRGAQVFVRRRGIARSSA